MYNHSLCLSKFFLGLSALLLIAVAVISMLRELSLLSFMSGIFATPIEPSRNASPMRFAPDGSFQLSIFEDLHYGEGVPRHIHKPSIKHSVLD